MSQIDQQIRFGIVGTSFISDWFADAARETPGCSVTAVYSRDDDRGAAFAQKHGIPLHFSSWEAFLSSDEIDAVYLASPNCMHYPQAMAALDHGKHVLCEKPLALNTAQAQAMISRARETGLTLLEAIRPVHDPFLQVVVQALPRIGRVRRATFEFCQYSSRYERYNAGEYVSIFDASLGNAALLDLGVYCLHTCVALLGAPAHVHAASSFLPNGTEVAGTILLNYEHMQATVSYSKVTQSVFPSIIQGEAGTISFDTLNQPTFVELHLRGQAVEKLPLSPVKPNMNMIFEIETFCRCVRGQEETARFDAQSVQVMKIMDEVRKQMGIDFDACEGLSF